MFENYFKATLRHCLKSKVNFVFKLSGLTLALFSLLVISLYVSFQLSFDKYHRDFKNIYRINSDRDEDGVMKPYATVPPGIGPALKAEFPEIKSFTRMSESTRTLIKYDDKLLRSQGLVEADSSIFSVLTFTFIEGNKKCLAKPGTVVLTETLAKQIFGDEPAIGKIIVFPDKGNEIAEVTAVVKDLPPNTHLQIKAIRPTQATTSNSWEITWDGSVYLFVLLDERVNTDHFSEKINFLVKKNIPKIHGGSKERFSVFLQPISDIYLDPPIEMEFFRKGNSLYIYIFSSLGLFLLAIASVNYINLSIADFHNRKKEIGVRKILGVKKKQIALYLISETVVLCLIALCLSGLLLYLMTPKVLPLLDANLHFVMLFEGKIIALAGLAVLLLTIFSTVYPAIQLSANSPIGDLNNEDGLGKKLAVRKSLLLFQFIVSTICMTGTFIVGRQINYIQNKNLGYNRHNVVSLILPEEYPRDRAFALKNDMNNLTGVLSTSYAYYHVTGVPYFTFEYEVEINNSMRSVLLGEVFVDHDYLQTMGIKLIAGRNFDIKRPADSTTAFIINETAAKEFGWDNPVGKRIRLKQSESDTKKWDGTVIGLVQDFNTRSLHNRIEPVVMRLPFEAWPGYCLNVRFEGEMNKAIPVIENAFEKVSPGFLADIRIIEDMFNDQYQEEYKIFRALQVGTWVIVFVSGLGIFSLSLYMSIRRMKEFGIRKVLGATSAQITLLHAGSFLKLALIANVISLPTAYWLANEWLEQFEFRTVIDSLIFLTVTLNTVLLVCISAGYSSIRAGKMNPLEVIKMG